MPANTLRLQREIAALYTGHRGWLHGWLSKSSAPFNLTQPDVYFDPAILG